MNTGQPKPAPDSPSPCPICGRPMLPGISLDRHHWVPRSAGGRNWDCVHQVCHRMIHRLFEDSELAAAYSDAAALRRHPEMARFVAWVRKKPPEYVDWPKAPRHGRGRRRNAGRQ